MAKVLVMLRKAPYGTVYAAEAIRAIMGLVSFEVEVEVLFIHDGVYVAKKHQDPEALDMKSLGAVLPQLKDMDIEKFYACDQSLKERNLTIEDLTVEVELCTPDNFEQKLSEFDHILPF